MADPSPSSAYNLAASSVDESSSSPSNIPSSSTPNPPFSSTTINNPPASSGSSSSYTPPASILIIGSGVYGLSTAYALSLSPLFGSTSITVVDRSTPDGVFPSPDAASVDSSRIVRSDYADPAYAALAAKAHEIWRRPGKDSPGGEGRYSESGFALVAHDDRAGTDGLHGQEPKKTGMQYVKESYHNVLALAEKERDQHRASASHHQGIQWLSPSIITTPLLHALAQRGAFGDGGYLNPTGGWADAAAAMAWLFRQVQATGRVSFLAGTVESLTHDGSTITGAVLEDGRSLSAELVVVAAGAWTGRLVDLASQVVATGQDLAYIDLTAEEQAALEKMPVVLNLSTGLFIIPPRKRQLKVARHAYGYLNPVAVSPPPLPTVPPSTSSRAIPPSSANLLSSQSASTETPSGSAAVFLPRTFIESPALSATLPPESERVMRTALRTMLPISGLEDRPFARTRLCWYSDTATGDWLIDFHPGWSGLFIATGDCGHAFKFLPVLGDEIVKCISGRCASEFKDKWSWRKSVPIDSSITATSEKTAGISTTVQMMETYQHVVTEDGSRGGKPGIMLDDAFAESEAM